MKFVALISGGKDSFYNIIQCQKQGHELAALANLYPQNESQYEIDSFMFQTVGHDIVSCYSQCVPDVPLYRQPISGTSANVHLEYTPTADDEIEDLYLLLHRIQQEHPDIEGVSCGAILSHYQRTRVENVCDRMGLTCLAYLWQRDQAALMLEMCDLGLDARLIKCAAVGLNEKHLGRLITEMLPILTKLNQMYDVHICGEGGEFETLVLDAPFFTKRLEITEREVVSHSSDCSYLKMQVEVVDKAQSNFEAEECEAGEASGSLEFLDEDFRTVCEGVEENDESKIPVVKGSSFSLSPVVSSTPFKLYISNVVSTATDTESQTHEILNQLVNFLKAHESTLNDIQHVTILVRDMSEFASINKIYASFWKDTFLPPSRVCVQTTLPKPFNLQFSCTVLKPSSQIKRGIHIRSRSSWAPHNIGPYSQAIVETRDTFKTATLSGQIPLIPATMELYKEKMLVSAALSLQHLYKVKSLVDVKLLASVVCYVTTTTPAVASQVWNNYIQEVEHGQDFKDRLIIVQVTDLPRGATIEWGGLAYEKVARMYEDDDETDVPRLLSSALELSEAFRTNIVSVNENFNIVKMMANDVGLVIDFLRSPALGNSHVTVMTLLANVHKLAALGLPAEWVPVVKVWDSDGVEFAFGITWIV